MLGSTNGLEISRYFTQNSVTIFRRYSGLIPGYAKALSKLGYLNERRLAFMHDGDPVSEIKSALKISHILAKAIVDEGLGLHPRAEAAVVAPPSRHLRSRSRSPRSRSRSPSKKRFGTFNSKVLLTLVLILY